MQTMAEKRMFTQKIVDSDAFLDMPLSTQALYFHLNMRADDDGFINNPKRIQRTIGASEDDLKLLVAKRFCICFENGVIVIKHWRMHNTLRKDRYNPTQYVEQFDQLEIKGNGIYTEKALELPDNQTATTWQPDGNQPATQYSIDKYSIDKKSYIYIVDYLNQKAGTKYKASSKKTQTCIHARLAEGFTEDDFKVVIDKKCAEWLGTDFEQYLRPETLFGTKFESYLNAKVTKKQNSGVPKGSAQDDLDDLF
jgi:uncharacterized phage protein (TIGR02220 family)